jgi:hypothetical protein
MRWRSGCDSSSGLSFFTRTRTRTRTRARARARTRARTVLVVDERASSTSTIDHRSMQFQNLSFGLGWNQQSVDALRHAMQMPRGRSSTRQVCVS